MCSGCWEKPERVNVEEYEALVEGYRMIQMYPDALGSPLNTSTATQVDKGEGKGDAVLNRNNNVDMINNNVIYDQNGDSYEGSPLAKRSK